VTTEPLERADALVLRIACDGNFVKFRKPPANRLGEHSTDLEFILTERERQPRLQNLP